jgi:mannose-6-phosphate isomerase-like protein (cupin superfamily)
MVRKTAYWRTIGGGDTSTQQGLYVPDGKDRSEEELKIRDVIPLQIKVSTDDTDGALFVFEHADTGKGGPPRHFHYDQDEWFYAIEGDFAFEVGEGWFTLRPGDSLLAPRMVPHVWAYSGEEPGRCSSRSSPPVRSKRSSERVAR